MGVYVHGLYLQGALWGKGSLVESAPRILSSPFPMVYVTYVPRVDKRDMEDVAKEQYGPKGGYECPLYRYPERTDRHLILCITLPTLVQSPLHWIQRGVALLCVAD